MIGVEDGERHRVLDASDRAHTRTGDVEPAIAEIVTHAVGERAQTGDDIGVLASDIAESWPLTDFSSAIAAAERVGHTGKSLLKFE